MFTVKTVWYKYYNDTKASNCIGFGPALFKMMCGMPTRFVIQVTKAACCYA